MQATHPPFFRTVFGRLIVCFLAAMLVLFLFMQIVFSFYARHLESASAQNAQAECMRMGAALTDELRSLRNVHQSWLLDEETSLRIQGEEPLTTSLIYQMYFQAHRRAALLFNTSSIKGLYLYLAYADYLLPVVYPDNSFYQMRGAVQAFLHTYAPSSDTYLVPHGNLLLLINAYSRQRATYSTPYQMAIAAIVSDRVFHGTRQQASWMIGPDGHVFTYENTVHDRQALAALSPLIDAGETRITAQDGTKYAAARVSIPTLGMPLYYIERIDTGALDTIVLSFHLILICIVVLLVAVFGFLSRRLIQRPLLTLREALAALDGGDYGVRLTQYDSSSDFERIGERFNRMAATLQQLIEREYHQRIQLNEAKFHLLQAQINPHFLYNSLFQMNSLLALEDYDTLEQMLINLGEYFQYIFKSSSGTVRLADELHYAKSYAFIQQVRFSGRVRIQLDAPPAGWEDTPIPCMTLQPILENAFQHGFGKAIRTGEMRVFFTPENETLLTVHVENTGTTLTDGQIRQLARQLESRDLHANSALVNIQNRLILLLGEESRLSVSNLGGTGFGITFSLKKEDGAHAL